MTSDYLLVVIIHYFQSCEATYPKDFDRDGPIVGMKIIN